MTQGHAVPSHTSPMAMKEQAPHRLMSEWILPKATAPRLTLTSATLNGIPYGDKNLSQVFTSHLKTRGWSQQRLHKLHIVMFVLTFFMYVCHIISLPPFEILGKKMVIIFEKTRVHGLCFFYARISAFQGLTCIQNDRQAGKAGLTLTSR